MTTYPILHPQIPYADHHYPFNPQFRLSDRHHGGSFLPSPQIPSPELFTARETDRLLSFLGGFDRNEFDRTHWNVKLEPVEQAIDWHSMNSVHGIPSNAAPYSNPHLGLIPNPSGSRRKSFPMSPPSSSRMNRYSSGHNSVSPALPASSQESFTMTHTPSMQFAHLELDDGSSLAYSTQDSSSPAYHVPDLSLSRTKSLLSTPQKRLNHIMSEQKRRNAIRDGYAQLITLLSDGNPDGAGAGLVMPTRGRPKGSGTKGKQGKGSESESAKGKSGVLFRTVEYCHWLEEGRDALKEEVERLEAAAGILSL